MKEQLNVNERRLAYFQKARQGRYERAIEDDPFAVKLFERKVEERRKFPGGKNAANGN